MLLMFDWKHFDASLDDYSVISVVVNLLRAMLQVQIYQIGYYRIQRIWIYSIRL